MEKPISLHISAQQRLLKLMLELTAQGVDRLPGERELCERLEVSLMTLRKVVCKLAAEGRINSVPRKGHFISQAPRYFNIGVVMCDEVNVSFLRSLPMLRGVLEVAERECCFINIIQMRRKEQMSGILKKHSLDGCIWYSPGEPTLEHVEMAIGETGLPSVIATASWMPGLDRLPCHMSTDLSSLAASKARFLLERGHRKIARLNMMEDQSGIYYKVETDSFMATLAEAGGLSKPEWSLSRSETSEKLEALLRNGELTAATVNGGRAPMRKVFEVLSRLPNAGGIELLADDIGPEFKDIVKAYPKVKLAGVCVSPEVEIGHNAASRLLAHLKTGCPMASVESKIRLIPWTHEFAKSFLHDSNQD